MGLIPGHSMAWYVSQVKPQCLLGSRAEDSRWLGSNPGLEGSFFSTIGLRAYYETNFSERYRGLASVLCYYYYFLPPGSKDPGG